MGKSGVPISNPFNILRNPIGSGNAGSNESL